MNAKLFSGIAKAKSEWEATFDAVTDLLTVRDKDYRVIQANQAAFRRFGLEPEELIGKKCYEVFRQSDQPCTGCYVSETLLTKNPVSVEVESQYLRGIFRFQIFPILGQAGELIGVVEMAREITEEKRLETEKDVVNNINKILASSLDVKHVIQAVHSELKRVLDCDRMTVALFDEEEKGFHYLASAKQRVPSEFVAGAVYPREGTHFERLVETGLPVIIANIAESDSRVGKKLKKEGVRSALLFPLEYKGKIVGTMNLGSGEANHFSEASYALLRQIAPGLAISIQNALLFEEIRKRLNESTILYEITKISSLASLNMDQMLTEISENLSNLLKFEYLVIFLVEEDTKRLKPYTSSKNPRHCVEYIKGLGLRLGVGIVGWVAQEGHPLLVNNVKEERRYLCGDEAICSEMSVPLKVGSTVIGVIDVQSKERNVFSEDDLRLFNIAAGQIATVLENIRLRDEIRESEEKYRTVVETALDGVCALGADYRLKFVNQKFSEILGFTREELINMDFREFLEEESRKVVAEREEQRDTGIESSPHFESRIIRKDGRVRIVEIGARRISDSKGDENTVMILKDVTERRKMEEELFRAEKLRAVAEMARGVAHDFNNALAAILGNTQLLLYSSQDEEAKETLRTIEKVAKDSSQTVRRLQDFTRNRVHQELSGVDVNSLIRDSIEITKPKWKDGAQRGRGPITIVPTVQEIPFVWGNDSELRGVFTSMILNSIEAMPDGGKIEICTFRRKNDVIIQISDTGVGIAEETKKRIFEPFFTTKPFTNTGLGLSMSYGIIKRFGGKIEVVSEPGDGATFTVTLPVGATEKNEIGLPQTIKEGKQPVSL